MLRSKNDDVGGMLLLETMCMWDQIPISKVAPLKILPLSEWGKLDLNFKIIFQNFFLIFLGQL